jgi:hypothetical protein
VSPDFGCRTAKFRLGPNIWLREEISEPFLFVRENPAQQEGASPVKQPKTVNVLFVASASSVLHGALAVVFVPFLSMLMLSLGALPAPFHRVVSAEHGMAFALVAPIAYAAMGFALGAWMAFLFNMFVKMLVRTERPLKIAVEPTLEVQGGAVVDAV